MPTSATNDNLSGRTPVYFLGIGGPNSMENTGHPAYAQLTAVGREITTKVKPKAVVVFSAHWQGGPKVIKINVAEQTDIIYDFYGFPPHYYLKEFPNKGSSEVAEKVIEKLANVAFDPNKNPLDVPIVQVSLYDNEDPDRHYCVGEALEGLRDEGILIVGAGMAVHNTRDFRMTLSTGETMPYAFSFDEALREAATAKPEERQAKMSALMQRSDAREAHPSVEHLLPIHVSTGAAGSDLGEQLWTLPEGSLSWAQYRFGKVVEA
ncbi:putative aromatic ring-opening dioxygenase LigB subunit [Viridothelium virens]|uniref:Putative aromatic ring-opening dioxygenase LigB subunit n=1 Tax=Viridothelium virens TaxID=1048519 RepID=A0A6A6HAR5_VIRVR|nr:putative aromatic ring-opening dioxygenase LigB subunit [Viridothelium virens]